MPPSEVDAPAEPVQYLSGVVASGNGVAETSDPSEGWMHHLLHAIFPEKDQPASTPASTSGPEWHTGGPEEIAYAPGGATQEAVLAQRQASIDKINQVRP